jgi:hypothetical protein
MSGRPKEGDWDRRLQQGLGHFHFSVPATLDISEVPHEEPRGENEAREIRAPNLLIWSQTRCRCAIAP